MGKSRHFWKPKIDRIANFEGYKEIDWEEFGLKIQIKIQFIDGRKSRNILKYLLIHVGAVSFHLYPSQNTVGDPISTAPSSHLN